MYVGYRFSREVRVDDASTMLAGRGRLRRSDSVVASPGELVQRPRADDWDTHVFCVLVITSTFGHRVHHGSNREYLDRNHGSILIIWDKLFGTFEAENEQVVYGLTSNVDSFNPLVIASHEFADIGRDIAGAQTWRDRWSFLLRRPGWAYARRLRAHEAAA